MSKQLEIAIAGAGIGGLAVAAALRHDGHQVRVFDQFDAPAPVGSGLVVQPVGLAVLDALDAGEAARRSGNRITRMFGHESNTGDPVLDVSYTAPGKSRFGLAIHRSALFQSLYDCALAAGVEIVPSHRVTGRNGQRLTFENGQAGPFDLIIDASGAGSPLSPMTAMALDYGAIWGSVDWPDTTDLPYDELRQAYRQASHMLGVLPIGQMLDSPGQKAAIFWSLPAGSHGAWLATPLEVWRAQAEALWPAFAPFAKQITDHNQMTMARYAHGTLAKPYSDGLVHIGDAAHRASPQLGQGANMALLDAAALAAALRQARGDVALAALWYANGRRWHVRAYQLMSRLFTPQYQSNSTILPILRDKVLFPLSRISPLPRVLTRLVCGDLLAPAGPLLP